MVLKAASFVPQSSMRMMELWKEAGLPDGVINVITTSRAEAEILLEHPDIKGGLVRGFDQGRQAYIQNGRRQRQTASRPCVKRRIMPWCSETVRSNGRPWAS